MGPHFPPELNDSGLFRDEIITRWLFLPDEVMVAIPSKHSKNPEYM